MEDILDVLKQCNPFLSVNVMDIQGEHINNPNIRYTVNLIMYEDNRIMTEFHVFEKQKQAKDGTYYDWNGILVIRTPIQVMESLLTKKELILEPKNIISANFHDRMVEVDSKYIDELRSQLDTKYYTQIRLSL